MPPKRYSRAIEEKMSIIADQFAKWVGIVSSSNARLETISKQIAIQTTITANLVTAITKTTVIVTQTPHFSLPPPPPLTTNPTHESPKIQQENVIIQPSTLQPTYDSFKTTVDKLAVGKVWVSSSNQPVALPLQVSTTKIQANCNQGFCFRCSKTSHYSHECYPPKFVFLQSERKPPRELHEPRHNRVSLEDKAHFKGEVIDTCMRTISYDI